MCTKNKPIKPTLSLIEKFQYALLLIVKSFFSLCGYSFNRHVGNALGRLMWLVLKNRRRLAISNISQHLNLSKEEATELAYKAFKHNARSFLEITLIESFSFHPTRTTIRIAEPGLFKYLQECTRPIVAATAHLGAWELMAALVGDLYEAPRPRIIVVRQYPNKAVQNFISQCRESHNATMVGNKMVAAHVIRALKNKGIVAFLVDHKARIHEALPINFLNAKAPVNMGPALLALRGEAIVLPIFLLREGNGYVMHIQEPLDTTELVGTREEKVTQIAEFYTKSVEKIIKQYPEQWFWMHNRWKNI